MLTWIARRFGPLPSEGVAVVRDAIADDGLALVKVARAPDARAALAREIETSLALAHPALRNVRAAAADGEVSVAVLEHVDGVTLDAHLAGHPSDAVSRAIELLRVLVHVHARGLAHGDLKPDNVLVSGGHVRVIDLGLAAPLGQTALGGTGAFIAPELLAGAPLSVASDLFSFGATLRAAAATTSASRWPAALTTLVERCTLGAVLARPASADSALAALGAQARTIDRTGEPAWLGDRDALDRAWAILTERRGATIVVRAPPGAGRTRFVTELVRRATAARVSLADATLAHGDALARTARLLGEPTADAGALRAAEHAVAFVLDDADRGSDDARAHVKDAAGALAARRRGALVVVGADDALAAALVALGAHEARLEPLGTEQARAVGEAWGVRTDIAELVRVVAGRAGDLVRAVEHLAEHPGDTARDAAEAVAANRRTAAPRPAVAASPSEAIALARTALADDAPRRAIALLEGLNPALRAEAAPLLADAYVRAGHLSPAADVLEALGDSASASARLAHARVLERLGRHADARRVAVALLDATGSVAIEAAVVAATSTLALGEPRAADELAARGIERGPEDAAHIRLLTLRSDAALRSGDAGTALERAAAAEALARVLARPALLALTLSRVAAARALGGDPRRARDAYRNALAAAEQAGDVGALPPYVMNLATADHAIGELGDALAHYEEAALLAEKLGRAGSRAAALTNLAGVYVAIGAEGEAESALDAAARASDEARLPLYAAQVTLLRAELEAQRDPARADQLAREAERAFLACGAERQALEAKLCAAELALGRGEPEPATSLLASSRDALARAALEPRAALLAARLAARASPTEARRSADDAVEVAHLAGERELEARALALLADAHAALETGAEESLRTRARDRLADVAARLPAGLRHRYLASPERARIVAQAAAPRAGTPLERGLGESARRLVAIVRRALVETDEERLYSLALDEAIALTLAERAFLLRRRGDGRTDVAVARNLDRETIRNSRFRFSRSVAERVVRTGEPLMTASATEDPELRGARSVLDLGLRSIVCVPVRGPSGVIGALYLDHRFQSARFDEADVEVVQALGDILGVAIDRARLYREATTRAAEIERAHDELAAQSVRKDAELDRLAHELARTGVEVAAGGIVGRAPAMLRALDVARRVAGSDISVLIDGESGTGKELFARLVHDRSPRANGPFVAVNCGALPETLLESELFGHVRGAFTGATRDHPGIFRAAEGGTLFLDEIGELPLGMQTRLLRVLQEKEVRPLGGGNAVPVDVRILTATNRDLAREVELGRFRRDLYFRIVAVRLSLPPLRERREDIPAIVRAALDRIAKEPGMRAATLSREALGRLVSAEWPGNVRELEQALRRAVATCDGPEIGPDDLGLDGRTTAPKRKDALRTFDRRLVEQALRAAGGNRTRAAEALGVSRVTLHRWVTRHAIEVPTRPGRPRAARTVR